MAEFDKAVHTVEVSVRSPDGTVEVLVAADEAIRDVTVTGPLNGRSSEDRSRAVGRGRTAAS